jgi:hypothetical protein
MFSFGMLGIIGPFVYPFFGFLYEDIKAKNPTPDTLVGLAYAFALWLLFTIFGIIGPAVWGYIWGIPLLRFVSYVALILYFTGLLADILLIAFDGPYYRFLWGCAFFIPLAPLGATAWLLIKALRHEPWFNPNATLEEIGPSRGTIGDYEIQAGLDEDGNLPPEQLTSTLKAPAPPPRWLCYVAPPIAAARMRRWWYFALFTPICLAALVFAAFIPLRAILVYGLIGSFADRLRSIQAYRKLVAESQARDKPGAK